MLTGITVAVRKPHTGAWMRFQFSDASTRSHMLDGGLGHLL
jgi:hypothetical protein